MENREREKAAIDGLEDDALELSLGLRPAPVRLPNLKIPAEKPPEISVREISGDLSLKSESEKELQAARRREAMRKRKSKASAMNEVFSERRRRRNGDEPVVSTTASFLPRLVGEELKGIPPVTGGDVEKISGAGGNCSGGSSSGGSGHQSTSGQGGSSSDGGSPPDQQCQTLQKVPSPGELGLESEKKPMSNEVARGPPDPSMGRGGEALLVSQMPCVSTTGNGPNGRTITGFLYRYTKSEVSIVCVCHGTAFSPAGFVEHAGGIDVENPLRRITVVPFALS